jgi:hypothetical protein
MSIANINSHESFLSLGFLNRLEIKNKSSSNSSNIDASYLESAGIAFA